MTQQSSGTRLVWSSHGEGYTDVEESPDAVMRAMDDAACFPERGWPRLTVGGKPIQINPAHVASVMPIPAPEDYRPW